MVDIISYEDFLDRKVNQHIAFWKYGKTSTEEFKNSMLRLGYDEKTIDKSIDDYFNA